MWDRYLFDDDLETFYRLRTEAICGGALRVDFGQLTDMDTLVMRRVDNVFKPQEAQVSTDLKTWHSVAIKIEPESAQKATVLRRSYTVDKQWTDSTVNKLSIDLTGIGPVQYIRIPGQAKNVAEIIGFKQQQKIDRAKWRASNAFASYPKAPAQLAWSGQFVIDEAARGSYLVVACMGPHGRDGAYAALRVNGRPVGAPRRAVSYPVNHWENGTRRLHVGFSYYFPVTDDMIGKKIDAVVMQFKSEDKRRQVELGQLKPEVWITAYPVPYESKELIIE